MNRTPQAKSQAAILVREMKAAGTPIKHQQALEMVAKMTGFRDWHSMTAAPAVPAEPAKGASPAAEAPRSSLSPAVTMLNNFITLAWDVINSSDNAGCDAELTVTDAGSVNKLQQYVERIEKVLKSSEQPLRFDPTSQVAVIWSVEDIYEIRPDLTHEEALQVLQYAKRKHDAEFGITWDILRDHASWLFSKRELKGTLHTAGANGVVVSEPVKVRLSEYGRVVRLEGAVGLSDTLVGHITFEGLDREYPVEKGRLFGEHLDYPSEQLHEFRQLMEALEEAGELPSVKKP